MVAYAFPDPAELRRLHLQDRLHQLIVVDDALGCWLWTGTLNEGGYAVYWESGSLRRAHRLAYELWIGPIPTSEGGRPLDLDHTCHNDDPLCEPGPNCWHRRCIFPGHLVPKTRWENVMASERSMASIHAAKTHCPKGHRYPTASVRGKSRKCPTCHSWRESARQWNQRHPDQPRPLDPPALAEPE